MKHIRLRFLFTSLFFLLSFSLFAQDILSFPEAEGFGRYSKGARGHTSPSIYFVTNLNDSGPGSFRDAVSQSGRFVIFRVSGIINLQSKIAVAANTTIAGQTAPGDGVVLYGRGVSFSGSSNTIARFLRIRLGANLGAGKNDDASGISNGQNIMLDHMSFTWGLDEVFSINWDNKGLEPDNITIQNSIIGQGLQRHNHSAGGLIQTNGKISILKSLYASNKTRNPKVKGVNEFVNNVVYNFGNANTTYSDHSISADAYILGGESSGESNVIILDNYFVGGPSTPASKSSPFSRGNGNFNLYQKGNYYDNNQNGTLDGQLVDESSFPGLEPGNFKTAVDYANYPSVSPTLTAVQAYDYLIENVGAIYPRRDQVDEFIVNELNSRGTAGQYVYRESDLPLANGGLGNYDGAPLEEDTDNDGIPDSWEDKLGLDKNDATDALKPSVDPEHAGYLNIEVYLNSLAMEDATDFIRPPKNVKSTSESFELPVPNSKIILTWENAQENDVVLIEKSTDLDNWVLVHTAEANATSYEDSDGLLPNTTYYYRLKAKNNEEESVVASISVKTPAIPTAPELVSVPYPAHESNNLMLREGAIDLKWVGSDNTSYYVVYFGDSPQNLLEVSTPQLTALTYRVENLLQDKTYYWRVDAINDKGITVGDVWSFKSEKIFPKGLIGHWTFDETTQDELTILKDISTYQTHGEISHNPDEGVNLRIEEGISGGAIDLKSADPSSYAASIPHQEHLLLNNSSFSMGFWMKAESGDKPESGVSAYILCKGSITNNPLTGATGNRFNIEVKGNDFRFAIDNDELGKDEITTSATPFFVNEWVYVTIIRDVENNKIKIFRNGTLAVEGNITKALYGIGEESDLVIGNIGALEFLKENVSNSAPYKGKLDDIKLFNYALNTDEILTEYLAHIGIEAAHTPTPLSGATTEKNVESKVSWQGGSNAQQFNIYLGTDENNLALVETLSTSIHEYTFLGLEKGTTYFWRVDAVGAAVQEGPIWSFKTNPLSRELVGYYSFDEADQMVKDYSKYANNGTAIDFPSSPFLEDGVLNGAANFSETSTISTKRFEIPSQNQIVFDRNSFTISLWMRGDVNTYTTSGTNAYLIQKGTFSNPGLWYGIQLNHGGNLVFAIDDNVTKNEVTTNIASNNLFNKEWNHIVGIRDVGSNTISLYINGVFVKSATTKAVGIGDLEKPLYIGNSAENKSYRDQIDEVKLYNYALSAEDIGRLYAHHVPVEKVSDMLPVNESTGVELEKLILEWKGSEEKYNVYFGESVDDLQLVGAEVVGMTYELPNILKGERTYYWRVDAVRDEEAAIGDVVSFTTKESGPKKELVGYYKFDDAVNIGKDYSKYNNHGIAVGTQTISFIENGKSGGAVNFETATVDNTKAIEIPSSDQNLFDQQSFAISLWMKGATNTYTTSAANAYLIQKGTFSGPGFWYGLQFHHNGNLVFAVDDNVIKSEVTTSIVNNNLFNNEWHNIIAVRNDDDNTLSLYIDGVKVNSAQNKSFAIGDMNRPLLIGNSSETKSYRDLLDEVKLYNYALTDEEIQNIFENGTPLQKATAISPALDALNVPMENVQLKWESRENLYNVYLGTSSDELELVAGETNIKTLDLNPLLGSKKYYWRVDVIGEDEVLIGDVWEFTTETDQAEKPIIEEVTLEVYDGIPIDQLIGKLNAYVIENGVLENWRISSFEDPNGNGISPVRIDPATGEIYVNDANDYYYSLGDGFLFNVLVDNGEWISELTKIKVNIVYVNEAPSFAVEEIINLCNVENEQELTISNIHPGKELDQKVVLTFENDNNLFAKLELVQTDDGNAVLRYQFIPNAQGTAKVAITAQDDGGTLNGGVDSTTETVTFVVQGVPQIEIVSSKMSDIFQNEEVVLNVQESFSGRYEYKWYANDELIGSQRLVFVKAAKDVVYRVEVSTLNGCSIVASLSLPVLDTQKNAQLEIGNFLTPNNDGVNDLWEIKNITQYVQNEVSVYNASGTIVFNKKNYVNDWDGTAFGGSLPTGLYYYHVLVDGTAYKGYLNIVHQTN